MRNIYIQQFLLFYSERTEMAEGLSKTLCLLAVPATLNCHDLLNFVAPCHPTLQHIRIIRDGTPNQFMVLLECVFNSEPCIYYLDLTLIMKLFLI